MTVSSTNNQNRYEGNGTTDTFAFEGRVFSASDLTVQIVTRATDAVEETLTLTTDYSVTLDADGEGASITTVSGKIPSGTQDILIFRDVALTQTVDLPTGTRFPASSVEDALDKVTAIAQDLDEKFDRAVLKPINDSGSIVTIAGGLTADDLLKVNAAGTQIESAGVDASDIATLAGIVSDISDVAAIDSDVTAAASNNANITTCATNISAIIAAPTEASNAAASATLAGNWATKDDGYVTGTDNSAKSWAIGGTGDGDPSGGSAKAWATTAEDTLVDGAEYSAKHYAAKAAAAVNGLVVSANDTTPGNLEAKLLVGDGLSLSTQNDGGNETRTISQDIAGATSGTVASDSELLANIGGNIRKVQAGDIAGLSQGVPVGATIEWNSTTDPTGPWLEENGAAVSRTTYSALFAVIGTAFGAGDGSTTFNLPNRQRRTAVGAGGSGTGTLGNSLGNTGGSETHSLSQSEEPSRTFNLPVQNNNTGTGSSTSSAIPFVSGSAPTGSKSYSIGGSGSAHNNIQPSIVKRFFIRYE